MLRRPRRGGEAPPPLSAAGGLGEAAAVAAERARKRRAAAENENFILPRIATNCLCSMKIQVHVQLLYYLACERNLREKAKP